MNVYRAAQKKGNGKTTAFIFCSVFRPHIKWHQVFLDVAILARFFARRSQTTFTSWESDCAWEVRTVLPGMLKILGHSWVCHQKDTVRHTIECVLNYHYTATSQWQLCARHQLCIHTFPDRALATSSFSNLQTGKTCSMYGICTHWT